MLDSLFRVFDNIIIFDVETTGFDPMREEIIELSALRLDKLHRGLSYDNTIDILVKISAGKQLPRVISELTGIDEQLLENKGITKASAYKIVKDFFDCSNSLLVAYNAQFDLSFLFCFLRQFGTASLLADFGMLDALTVYKDRRPYPHTLSDAVSAYHLKTQNTHRAIDDSKATFELLCAMEHELDDLERYINLFGYNPKYGIIGSKIGSVSYLPQPYNMQRKIYE